VDVNLTSEGKVKLVPNTKIPMSYSVSKAFLKLRNLLILTNTRLIKLSFKIELCVGN